MFRFSLLLFVLNTVSLVEFLPHSVHSNEQGDYCVHPRSPYLKRVVPWFWISCHFALLVASLVVSFHPLYYPFLFSLPISIFGTVKPSKLLAKPADRIEHTTPSLCSAFHILVFPIPLLPCFCPSPSLLFCKKTVYVSHRFQLSICEHLYEMTISFDLDSISSVPKCFCS